MASRPQEDRNQEATVYMGNLDERVSDALIWELMLQAGPVSNVHLPKDRISMSHQGYGFCEFLTEDDADYACKIMNQIKLFGKPIRVNKASSDRKQLDIGANLFIGSLDPNVDERMLWDTFSRFGTLVQTANISRDPTTGQSKGYGFVSYDSFESADAAIEAMNGQYLMNKPVTVQFAFKKDGKGERHGTPAERLLAAQARKNNAMPTGPNSIPHAPAVNAFGMPRPAGNSFGPPGSSNPGGPPGAPPPPPPFLTGANAGPPGQGPPGGHPPSGPGGMSGPQPQQGYMPPPPPGFGGPMPGQPPFPGMNGMPPPPPGFR